MVENYGKQIKHMKSLLSPSDGLSVQSSLKDNNPCREPPLVILKL